MGCPRQRKVKIFLGLGKEWMGMRCGAPGLHARHASKNTRNTPIRKSALPALPGPRDAVSRRVDNRWRDENHDLFLFRVLEGLAQLVAIWPLRDGFVIKNLDYDRLSVPYGNRGIRLAEAIFRQGQLAVLQIFIGADQCFRGTVITEKLGYCRYYSYGDRRAIG